MGVISPPPGLPKSGGTLTGPLKVASGANAAQVAGSATGAPVVLGADDSSKDANVGVVVAPKGTGALSAQVPDNTSAGGNTRGAYSVDWQHVRGAASQVASGSYNTIGGGRNNATTGSDATVSGGYSNLASTNAVVGGGSANLANGIDSCIPGGRGGHARGLIGKFAFASGVFVASGDAQLGEHVLRRGTSTATPSLLTSDGGASNNSNQVILPNNGTYLLRLLVVARQIGGTAGNVGDSAGWEVSALVKRGANAAATVLVGGGGASLAPTYNDAGAAGWRIGVTADTTNGGLSVAPTGEANKIINWVARIMSVEVVG